MFDLTQHAAADGRGVYEARTRCYKQSVGGILCICVTQLRPSSDRTLSPLLCVVLLGFPAPAFSLDLFRSKRFGRHLPLSQRIKDVKTAVSGNVSNPLSI
jgi:hypothetical protein